MRVGVWLLMIGGGAWLASPCWAHHSFAMFDETQTRTVTGTIKEFQWTNPHSWLQVVVGDAAHSEEWSIETGGPQSLRKLGWKPTTLKAGDTVTVSFHPLKDGEHGGALLGVLLPDGRVLGQAPAAKGGGSS